MTEVQSKERGARAAFGSIAVRAVDHKVWRAAREQDAVVVRQREE
jgi:hypothetical protein